MLLLIFNEKRQLGIAKTLCLTRFSGFPEPKIKENLRETNVFIDFQ